MSNKLMVKELTYFEVDKNRVLKAIYTKCKSLEEEYEKTYKSLLDMFETKEQAVAAMVALNADTANSKSKVVRALLNSLHENEELRRDLRSLAIGITASSSVGSYLLTKEDIQKVGL
jgi:hypothetical protein